MPCEEVWIHPKWNYYHYIRGYLSVYLIRPYYYHYLPCPYCLLLLHGIVVIPNILYCYSKLQGEEACVHPESKYINIKYLVIIISYLLIYYYYLHSFLCLLQLDGIVIFPDILYYSNQLLYEKACIHPFCNYSKYDNISYYHCYLKDYLLAHIIIITYVVFYVYFSSMG